LANTGSRWPVRRCLYCSQDFRKAPNYATCGHPRCVKEHRSLTARARDKMRDHSLERRLPKWSAPDPYAPDDAGRRKIYTMLVTLDAHNADTKTLPSLVETVAVQAKVKPAEVLEVWRSMQKEMSNARGS